MVMVMDEYTLTHIHIHYFKPSTYTHMHIYACWYQSKNLLRGKWWSCLLWNHWMGPCQTFSDLSTNKRSQWRMFCGWQVGWMRLWYPFWVTLEDSTRCVLLCLWTSCMYVYCLLTSLPHFLPLTLFFRWWAGIWCCSFVLLAVARISHIWVC